MRGDPIPVETELRLAIDPDAVRALRAHRALKDLAAGGARTARVRTVYHDTDDRRLRRGGIALRVRRDGRRWLTSVKGAALPGTAAGPVSRPELEWHSAGGAIDAARLAATPWRATFAKALRKGTLAPLFSTDVVRTSIPLAFPDGTRATLMIDLGAIALWGGRSPAAKTSPIAEVELELTSGEPRRLVELAMRLAADLPLAVEPRGKADRGYALADGVGEAPSRAQEIVHAARATAGEAFAAIVAECARQVAANVPGFRGGRLHDPEWVHQMRIGVRRLRSCLALADGVAPAEALEFLRGETRWVLDALGPARDLDVFVVETLPAAIADLEAGGGDTAAAVRALSRAAARRRRTADAAALACVASSRFTRFVLAAGALATTLRAEGLAGAGERRDLRARRYAARLVERRARRLAAAGAGLEHASVEARHAVRIAAKKLRYATEFFATLFPRRRTRDYRDALASLQDALGTFNDAAVAARVAATLGGPAARATVAIEAWSAARTAHCAEAIDEAWGRFAKARPFWTRD